MPGGQLFLDRKQPAVPLDHRELPSDFPQLVHYNNKKYENNLSLSAKQKTGKILIQSRMFKNQPKGLIPAALSNMGERFGYYIMNAVLVLFLCSKFGLSEETSALVYSFFYAGIYVLSLVGGIIADRTQNYKGTIISVLLS